MNREPLWKRLLPFWLHSWIRFGIYILILGSVIAVGVGFFYFRSASQYDLAAVGKMPAGTVFHDRDNREILLPGANRNRQLTREEIPDFLVKCLLAREDARFYAHPGIDFRGLARATARNLRDRNFTQGGSTISMQLTRNSYEGMRGKTLHRKFLEIALTLRVESHYSKDEILAHYLNRIYFGAGAHGVEQAARTYFGMPASELNDAECAMIVGIIRGPHIFSPFRNYESAIEQRDQTLGRLLASGEINDTRHQEILVQPIRLLDERLRESQSSFAMSAVRRELDRIIDRELDRTSGDLQVFTTLDSNWQARIERDLAHVVASLETENKWKHSTFGNHTSGTDPGYLQYAAITLETRTGEVMAWVGGRDISHSGVDRTRSRRDLGSAFEPWVSAAAAERGKLVLPGRPIQTGRQIGSDEVERIARRCGITGPFSGGEDLFRGWVASTPVEIAIALSTLGNQGQRPRPSFIREIRDSSGRILYQGKTAYSKAIGAEAAKESLRVFENRGGSRTFTGFTGNERDAWALRIGPNGTTVIWIGFDHPQAITSPGRLKKLLNDLTSRLAD
ncbi:MAG: transglycosylase domain-containing protein [Luteolibacter sp.]|jgi:membrane peptidoglycan carboxypeptidase